MQYPGEAELSLLGIISLVVGLFVGMFLLGCLFKLLDWAQNKWWTRKK